MQPNFLDERLYTAPAFSSLEYRFIEIALTVER